MSNTQAYLRLQAVTHKSAVHQRGEPRAEKAREYLMGILCQEREKGVKGIRHNQ